MSDKNSYPHLRTERLILRFAEDTDIPEIFRYFRENEERFAPTHPRKEADFYSEVFWRDRISKAKLDFENGKSVRLIMLSSTSENGIVGTINLNEIVRGLFQASYVGYDISGCYEGQGLMREGMQRVVEFAFSELNLHRLMANYQPSNIRSGNLLKRLGFIVEGTAGAYLFINGDWRDHVLTSLTNYRWKGDCMAESSWE